MNFTNIFLGVLGKGEYIFGPKSIVVQNFNFTLFYHFKKSLYAFQTFILQYNI